MESVHRCLDMLISIKFEGNFNTWGFIQPSYCLKCFLSENEAEKAEIQSVLREDVRPKWDDDKEHHKSIEEILDGKLIESAKKQLIRYGNDSLKDEYDWRSNLLIKYLYVFALGAIGSLSKSKVLNKINSHIIRILKLYIALAA